MIEDVLVYMFIIICSFVLGWKLRGISLIIRFGSDPDHFIAILKQIKAINEQEQREAKLNEKETELAIERHGDVLYAFVKDTDQFIAQGTSLDSVLTEANKRFPNRKFFGVIPNGDPAKELA